MQIDKQPLPERGTVYIWDLSLDEPQLDLPEILSEDELGRYAAISHPPARSYFLRSRAALRMILSSYSGIPANVLLFVCGENGKPELADGEQALQFNLSHSGNRLLLAVTTGSEIGIDIERTQAGRDYAALARRFFTAEESLLIDSGTSDSLFYRMWVLKEAAVKARGMKLLAGLDRFECLLAENGELRLRDKLLQTEDEGWSVKQWEPAGQFAAAVIVRQTSAVFIEKTLLTGRS